MTDLSPPPVSEKAPEPNVAASIMKKAVFVFLIFILLQIPLMMVNGVMEERQRYNVSYPEEYQGPGAAQQTIIGPVLAVPYHFQLIDENIVPVTTAPNPKDAGKVPPTKIVKTVRTETGYLQFFPKNLTVEGKLVPETRDEGKFKSILYTTVLEFKGQFNTAEFKDPNVLGNELLWDKAFITQGISDLRGIRKETQITAGGQPFTFVPGVNHLQLFDTGQYVNLTNVPKSGTYPFSFKLYLNGSRELNLFPAGKENQFNLSSTWQNPTFTGGFLPTTKTIGKDGFDAIWEISYFSRNLPQFWTSHDGNFKSSLPQYMIGVKLGTPIEFYRTAIRAVKYGSLFIIMTFLAFFIFEVTTRLRIHEVQYLLVGLALCLFYLMLIALSEWIPFLWAYALACIPTIAQITWYTQAFSKTRNENLWKGMAGLLTLLYVYLYVLLQLENFSLLLGAIGLFIALSVVMYVTRKIDWYNRSEGKTK